jgi:predicted nucleic acid-binding protein
VRAVLDTNVLASGFITAGSAPDRLIRQWLAGVFVLVYSEHIVEELTRTFERP